VDLLSLSSRFISRSVSTVPLPRFSFPSGSYIISLSPCSRRALVPKVINRFPLFFHVNPLLRRFSSFLRFGLPVRFFHRPDSNPSYPVVSRILNARGFTLFSFFESELAGFCFAELKSPPEETSCGVRYLFLPFSSSFPPPFDLPRGFSALD